MIWGKRLKCFGFRVSLRNKNKSGSEELGKERLKTTSHDLVDKRPVDDFCVQTVTLFCFRSQKLFSSLRDESHQGRRRCRSGLCRERERKTGGKERYLP